MINIFNPYSLYIDIKNYFYDENYFKQIQTTTKIISIGNLNTGGSGKTPLIRAIAESFRNQQILIVCKSYKANLKQPGQVNLNQANAIQTFGDEACLLKQLLPWCDVWSGPRKYQTVQAALSQKKYDIVFIDDGFSHRKIFRHCDIVLVDTSRKPSHYQLFPSGQMREDWKTLKRSHLVILTKTENVPSEQIQYFMNQIKPFQKNVITAQFHTMLDQKTLTNKLFLVTGIGNPKKLKTDLESQGYEIIGHQFYPDHYSFPESEQIKLLKMFNENKKIDYQIVMTGKDYIKMTHSELKSKIVIAEMSVSISDSDRKILDAQILS